MVVHQPACAVRAASFLIGEERQHHVTRRPAALPEPLADDREDHGVHVLHVHGAAAPDAVVAQFAGERVHTPVAGVGRDHVEVTVDEQRWPSRIRPADPGHHAGAAGTGFQHDGFQADLGEQSGDVFCRGALARTGMVAGVRGVDPDQFAAQGSDLILRCRLAGGRERGHPAIVPSGAGDRAREPAAPGGRPRHAGWAGCHLFAFARTGQICYRDAAGQASAVRPWVGYVRVAE